MMDRISQTVLRWCVAGVLLVGLAACDSNSPEPVVLQPKTISFEFPQFSGDDVEGGTLTLTSENQEDLVNELRADGFSPSEVIEATVTDVELIRRSVGDGVSAKQTNLFPFLVDAELNLVRSGTASLMIAQRSSFDPNAVVTPMDIVDDDAAAFVSSATPFGARLDLSVSDIGSDSFRMGARVTFRIEVEGV